MTRGGGWGGGADVILIPEIPYRVERIAETIQKRTARGSNFSVVAVAEGARDVDSAADHEAARLLVRSAKSPEAQRAAKAHLRNVEDAQREHTFQLARQLEAITGLESRVTILGYVQRGGAPCAADRLLATRLGAAAADLVAQGEFGYMVAARAEKTQPVRMARVAGKDKYFTPYTYWNTAARKARTGLGD